MAGPVHALNRLSYTTVCEKDADRVKHWSRVRGDITCRKCLQLLERHQ